jgi:hypothetical protein
MLVLSVISLVEVWNDVFFREYSSILTAFQATMIFGRSNIAQSLITFALPFICALLYSDAYREECLHKANVPFLIRSGQKRYYFSKAFFTTITSFLIIVLPLLVNQLFSIIAFPSSTGTTYYYDNAYGESLYLEIKNSIFPEIYMNHPFLNNLLHMILLGLFGSSMGLLTLAFSLFIRSRIIVILSTTIINLGCSFFLVNVLGPSFDYLSYFLSGPLPSTQMVPTVAVPCIAILFPFMTSTILILRRALGKNDDY